MRLLIYFLIFNYFIESVFAGQTDEGIFQIDMFAMQVRIGY